jgi:putative ABC transport system permease protein
MFAELKARIQALFRRRQLDDDLDQELQLHLDLLTEEHLRRGLSPEEARRAARLQVGGLTSIKERHREVRGLPMIETLWHDLKFAVRLIFKDRWISATAIMALALGIGVNAVGFTIVDTAFFRGLPVTNPHDLFTPCWLGLGPEGELCSVSRIELEEWRAALPALSSIAAYSEDSTNIGGDQAFAEQANGVFATANLFGVLGLQPILGRDFLPEDDRVGAEPVVLIGHRMWRDRFAFDRNVLGKTLNINSTAAKIIGVMPEGMEFPDNHQLWVPWTPFYSQYAAVRERRGLMPVVRIANKDDRQSAKVALTGLVGQLKSAYPQLYNRAFAVGLTPFTDQFIGGKAKDMFAVIMGAVTFVLLIACANVANLLLSRSGHRAPEIAIRMALGAARWRVVRQLLIESLVLAGAGGALGLLLASYGVRLFETAMADSGKPYWLVFTLNYNVVIYVAAVCIATAVVFGLAPALQVTKKDNSNTLKESARSFAGSRRMRRWSGALVVVELTLAVTLLAGAGLMIRSFYNHYALNLGFSPDHLVTFGFDLLDHDYRDDDSIRRFVGQLEPRIAALPGIESVAVTTGVPPRDRTERMLEIEQQDSAAGEAPEASVVAITPKFFDVLGLQVVRGRHFQSSDGLPGGDVILINQRFAEQYFPGQNPLGRRIRFKTGRTGRFTFAETGNPDKWRTVVGVTPTIRQGDVKDGYLNAVIYTPYMQNVDRGAYLLVRSKLPLSAVSDLVRNEVQAIAPNQPLRPGQTLEEWMASERWSYRVFGGLFAVLALIALTLSSVGLYAVMSYAVAQRRQEIGVRMAIGARSGQVAWFVLRRGLRQLIVGLAIGLSGAWVLSIVLADLLVEVRPGDPATLAAIAILLSIVSIVACLIPARRATRVDPVIALRAE